MAPTTVDLPDGQSAVLRDPGQLTAGQKRPLKILVQSLGARRFQEVVDAQPQDLPDDATDEQRVAEMEAAADRLDALRLDEREWDLLERMGDATLFALLDSWTLPQPVPDTIAGLADLRDIEYQMLSQAAGRVYAEHVKANGFTAASVENPASPTGASEPSRGPSEADQAVASETTWPEPESVGASTGTGPSLEG
jgi:hypothetical protein